MGTAAMLEKDAQVAWVEKRVVNGIPITDGISEIHRVLDDGLTYCQQRIPEPERHFHVLSALSPCLRCLRLFGGEFTQEQIIESVVGEVMENVTQGGVSDS